MLLGNRKEWNSDTWNNTEDPRKHYAKWQKSFTKEHIVKNSICMKCPE